MPAGRALAALAAENVFYSLSVAVVVIAGAVAMLWSFRDLSPEIRGAGVLSVALMVVVVVVALVVIWRRPALASGTLARLPVAGLETLVDRLRQLEITTYEYARQNRGRLGRVAMLEAVFHVFSVAESFLTVWLITGQSLLLESFVLDTVNRVTNVIFKMVPLRTGVDEAAQSALAAAIGLGSPTGVTVALVRKGRLIFWMLVGLALWTRRRPPTSLVGPPSPWTS